MDNDPKEKPEAPPVFIIPLPPERTPNRPISYWMKKFFACNPFYLVSAALLLYGVYLVSFDANFFGREISQLAFNFSSLQVYEILLVGTAIVLARRRIWYDSTLLVCLENLLVLVPFILISQAALLGHRTALVICLAGAVAVLLRFAGLKYFFKELNLPRRALLCGLALLLVNVVLPLVYRHLHESKIGTKPTEGAAYGLNRYSWLVLLPALLALINFMPKARPTGDLLPQRRWLPLGVLALWLGGTATHIYSLSYVYNFDWEFVFALPLVWVLAWTTYLRRGDVMVKPVRWIENALLFPALAIALLGLTQSDYGVFRTLTILNVACYFAVFMKNRSFTALHLMLISAATLAAGLARSIESAPEAIKSVEPSKWLLILVAAYGLYWIARSRNPKAGIFGGLATALSIFIFLPNHELALGLSAQCGLVFILLHSFRWVDAEYPGAAVTRKLACAIWFAHALMMVHWQWSGANAVVLSGGGLLLGVGLAVRLLAGGWRQGIVPLAALAVVLIPPGDFAAGKLQSTPAGFLAIAGSFLLFALGTAVALTKPRWNNHAAASATAEIEPTP